MEGIQPNSFCVLSFCLLGNEKQSFASVIYPPKCDNWAVGDLE